MQFLCLRNSFSIIIFSFVVINSSYIWSVAAQDTPRFRALFAYGDSMVDTGNNNFTLTIMKSNFAPYGVNLGVATGRFSNGRILCDHLADRLEINLAKVPPYLQPDISPEDFIKGISFASAGAGYDILTSTSRSSISLADQLKNWQEYRGKLIARIGDGAAATLVANTSLHLVVAGTEDIVSYFGSNSPRRSQYDLDAYTNLMYDSAASFLQVLYENGARNIGVVGVPPVGCFPTHRNEAGCAGNMNQGAELFNSKLSERIPELATRLKKSKIFYMDFYGVYVDTITDLKTWGFSNANQTCCKTGNKDVSYLCDKENPTTCAFKEFPHHFYWDGFHPTEYGHRMLSRFIQPYIALYE
ncbi:GDSL esterase/lipase At1g20120-like [Mercurialis annua]|uniref:GDSL esterase/lipase At1g20120-like n=1 Tax=Mercurialis annua TaxID=3986 RepID=UPI00215DFE96|nr:GDSL esterase/lipase At1g20120-like [Mercurialis annua]